MYSSGAWCGAWLAPGQNHRYQGLSGSDCFESRMSRSALVGEILRQVIPVFRKVRLVDVVIVLGEIGIPVVRLAADEAVEAVVAHPERPFLLRRPLRPRVDRDVVVLPDPEGAVAGVAEHVGDRPVLGRDVGAVAGEARRALGDRGEAVRVVVAAGEEGRARGGAERGRVPLGVDQAVVCEPLERRHLDPAAERRPGGKAGVVEQHDEDVRRSFRCRLGREGIPVGDGVADVELDLPLERRGDRKAPLFVTRAPTLPQPSSRGRRTGRRRRSPLPGRSCRP